MRGSSPARSRGDGWCWAGGSAAAGLSLVVGTPARRPRTADRVYGFGALAACALLLASSPATMLLGAVAAMLVAWLLYRAFAARR